MMQGKIVKGIAGFYYIHIPFLGVYECKAKGIFRNQNIKPLVGDNVKIDLVDPIEKKGNMIEILKRKNQLIRPAVSNVDQAFVIFSTTKPSPNFNLLDRFLINMLKQNVDVIICFNKTDMVSDKEIEEIGEIYERCGCHLVFTSVLSEEGLSMALGLLRNKTTVLAGPSGVGKSSIINYLKPDANMETGAISQKIDRGKHTTRHSELFHLEDKTYIMDTPGFSSLFVTDMEKEELKNYFLEFKGYEDFCRFQGCVHRNEPECAVKDAVALGKVSKIRYENYVSMYEELKNRKKY